VRLSDWTEQLVLGPALPEKVACHGQACCEDPVCEACGTAEAGAWCRFCEGWPPPFSGCADAP
jgi:hypothetical protein